MTDEQIEAALNACTFGQTKETRCKDCPLNSDKEPCITNLHLVALEYIGRLKHRAEVAEMAVKDFTVQVGCRSCPYNGKCGVSNPSIENGYQECYDAALRIAEKDLAEEGEDDSRGKD